jgi:hypothetical protein
MRELLYCRVGDAEEEPFRLAALGTFPSQGRLISLWVFVKNQELSRLWGIAKKNQSL